MFTLIKAILYLITVHILLNNGFDPTKKLLEFVTLMSCFLLMDITSYFFAKHSIEAEINNKKE